MKRKNYRIEINASAAHVFETMLGKTTYKQWTAEFNPTSDFEGHWELGEKNFIYRLQQRRRKRRYARKDCRIHPK